MWCRTARAGSFERNLSILGIPPGKPPSSSSGSGSGSPSLSVTGGDAAASEVMIAGSLVAPQVAMQIAPLKSASIFGGVTAYFPNAIQLTAEEKPVVTRFVQLGGRALSLSNKDLGTVTHVVIGANAREIGGEEATRVQRLIDSGAVATSMAWISQSFLTRSLRDPARYPAVMSLRVPVIVPGTQEPPVAPHPRAPPGTREIKHELNRVTRLPSVIVLDDDDDDIDPRTVPKPIASQGDRKRPHSDDGTSSGAESCYDTENSDSAIDVDDSDAAHFPRRKRRRSIDKDALPFTWSDRNTNDSYFSSENTDLPSAPLPVDVKPKMRHTAWACAQPSAENGVKTNFNENITEIFLNLSDIIESQSRTVADKHRANGYKKAAQFLARLPRAVTSSEDALSFKPPKGVLGSKLLIKIDEICSQGKLEQWEKVKSDKEISATREMRAVYGVGPVSAKRLYDSGLRTVEDISLCPEERGIVSPVMRIGAKYHREISLRIPRREIDVWQERVRESVQVGWKGLVKVTCVGSYRRGAKDSGDIDILVITEGPDVHSLLKYILENLQDFVVANLTLPERDPCKITASWNGIVRLSPGDISRRMDIKVYPIECEPFALLYFTGSEHYNRSMRHKAHKMGYSLSDKELAKVVRFKNKKSDAFPGVPVKGLRTEADVCRALGLPYLEPHQRNL